MNLECSVNGRASIPWNPTEHDMDTSREEEEGVYFAKYLTNQNLLQLQLSDSNFRRYFLLQCLILFQYLKSNVKFKTDTQVLSDDQVSTLMQCFSLEVPPFLAFAFLSKRLSSIPRLPHETNLWNALLLRLLLLIAEVSLIINLRWVL